MVNPCPTVAQLLDAVKSLTRQNDGTFQNAWARSFPDAQHCAEQGGYIYIDFPVPDRITRAFVTFAPPGGTMNQRTRGPNPYIYLDKPGINQNNVILVATFHTHPLSALVGGDQQPSIKVDRPNAYASGLPGIVISRDGIYSYGPDNRQNVTNPKVYPPPIPPPGGAIPVKLERGPQPPWTVPTQWPEGTGMRLRDENVKDRESVPGDVIVVEWADEGVYECSDA